MDQISDSAPDSNSLLNQDVHSSNEAAAVSKRSNNLLRKAHEICFFGDSDVAFVAFLPGGQVAKFSNKDRIEEVIQKYVDIPTSQRYKTLKEVDRVMKLRQLNHIEGEDNKVHYLSKQIHNLELQVKKAQVDIEILDANLGDYELPEKQCHSLPEILCCEKNLNRELQRVLDRKNFLAGNFSSSFNRLPFMARGGTFQNLTYQNPTYQNPTRASVSPIFSSAAGEELTRASVSPIFSSAAGEALTRTNQTPNYNNQLMTNLDPWISPFSSKVRNTIVKEILNVNGGSPDGNGTTSGQLVGSSFSSSLQDSRHATQTWPSLEKNIPDRQLNQGNISENSNTMIVGPFCSIPMNVTFGDNSNTNANADAPNTEYTAAAPTNPAPETPKDPTPLHVGSSEDEVGNGGVGSTTNEEWQGFLVSNADNLNLDELEFVV